MVSKETLKNLIELVPDKDIDILHQVIIKFIPSEVLEHDEIEAIEAEKTDRENNGTISHDDINWN